MFIDPIVESIVMVLWYQRDLQIASLTPTLPLSVKGRS
jgi:hypothetical protein